jgi:putative SOS response-associated peptidase YedK
MCGRFTQERPSADLAELFDAEPLVEDAGGHFNVAPTQDARVVVEREGDRRLTAYRWGLIPTWATGPSAGSKMFNARSETAPTSPAFRDAFRRRRCLVPVDAFYEWRRDGSTNQPYAIRHPDGSTSQPYAIRHRDGSTSQPYAIRHRDGSPLALAGLWSVWRDPATDELRRTFAILTTRPNELIAELHDRMPVILDRSAWPVWLDTVRTDPGELLGLLVPSSPAELEAFPVSNLVNSVRNDGPELVRPLEAGPGSPRPEGLGLA